MGSEWTSVVLLKNDNWMPPTFWGCHRTTHASLPAQVTFPFVRRTTLSPLESACLPQMGRGECRFGYWRHACDQHTGQCLEDRRRIVSARCSVNVETCGWLTRVN